MKIQRELLILKEREVEDDRKKKILIVGDRKLYDANVKDLNFG